MGLRVNDVKGKELRVKGKSQVLESGAWGLGLIMRIEGSGLG